MMARNEKTPWIRTDEVKKNENHSLLPSTIARILFCCCYNVSPSYVGDSGPGSLDRESGILPPSHCASTWADNILAKNQGEVENIIQIRNFS